MTGSRTVTYNTKYPLDYQREFINFLDQQIKITVKAYNNVGADWRVSHEVLTNAKNAYLEANELCQCYSCGTVFEKSYSNPNKFCSEHCKQSESLEVI